MFKYVGFSSFPFSVSGGFIFTHLEIYLEICQKTVLRYDEQTTAQPRDQLPTKQAFNVPTHVDETVWSAEFLGRRSYWLRWGRLFVGCTEISLKGVEGEKTLR